MKFLAYSCTFSVMFKGILNETLGLKETVLFERTSEVIKIVLCSSRVSHFRYLDLFDM